MGMLNITVGLSFGEIVCVLITIRILMFVPSNLENQKTVKRLLVQRLNWFAVRLLKHSNIQLNLPTWFPILIGSLS